MYEFSGSSAGHDSDVDNKSSQSQTLGAITHANLQVYPLHPHLLLCSASGEAWSTEIRSARNSAGLCRSGHLCPRRSKCPSACSAAPARLHTLSRSALLQITGIAELARQRPCGRLPLLGSHDRGDIRTLVQQGQHVVCKQQLWDVGRRVWYLSRGRSLQTAAGGRRTWQRCCSWAAQHQPWLSLTHCVPFKPCQKLKIGRTHARVHLHVSAQQQTCVGAA